MESLDEGIRSLDDVDGFLAFVHQIGTSHTKIPGFKAEYFWVSRYLSHFLLRQEIYCYILHCLLVFMSSFYGCLFDIYFVWQEESKEKNECL